MASMRISTMLCFAALVLGQGAAMAASDPVVMSFATVGDSRADPASAATAQDKAYLQNTRALSRILREIQAAKPKALFFNGDMIMGYTADKSAIARQYAYWRGMTAGLMENGTYVVPVTGNHEMQFKDKDAAGKTTKIARLENEELWRESMGDLILDTARWKAVTGIEAVAFDAGNAPPVGGPDGNQTSQSQLTFSFDAGGSHFAVIDTDPVGNDGHGPAHWLAEDFRQAKARGARRFFVFGHKPAYTYLYSATSTTPAGGLDASPGSIAARDAFWSVIENYGATYFAGHEHIYNISQPKGGAYQVLVGSGGSPFDVKASDMTKNPATDRTYAWATVRVHQDGSVDILGYGFDANFGPTRLIQQIALPATSARIPS